MRAMVPIVPVIEMVRALSLVFGAAAGGAIVPHARMPVASLIAGGGTWWTTTATRPCLREATETGTSEEDVPPARVARAWRDAPGTGHDPSRRSTGPASAEAVPETVTIAWDAPMSTGGLAITRYEYSIDGGTVWNDVAENPTVLREIGRAHV